MRSLIRSEWTLTLKMIDLELSFDPFDPPVKVHCSSNTTLLNLLYHWLSTAFSFRYVTYVVVLTINCLRSTWVWSPGWNIRILMCLIMINIPCADWLKKIIIQYPQKKTTHSTLRKRSTVDNGESSNVSDLGLGGPGVFFEYFLITNESRPRNRPPTEY